MFKRFFLTLVTALAVTLPQVSHSLSGSPPDYFFNWQTDTVNTNYEWKQGWLDDQPYIPSDGNWQFPVAFIEPSPAPSTLRMKVRLTGHNAKPGIPDQTTGIINSNCHGPAFANQFFVVIKPCAGHYPEHIQHRVGNMDPYGWWGWFMDPVDAVAPSNSWRIGLSLTQAAFERPTPIDHMAGWWMEGDSYGGTGAILQSMLLRKADPFWHELLVVVIARNPHTLFVENGMSNHPPVKLAWGGNLFSSDTEWFQKRARHANFKMEAEKWKLQGHYYKIVGSPADTVVNFDVKIFDYCDQYKIYCFGLMHNAGHASPEPGINLPWEDVYPGNQMDIRFDKMLTVFTNSSANHVWCGQDVPCARGHYNLGWAYRTTEGNYSESTSEITIPIRYKRHINIGGGIPDQPASATVDVTVRRLQAFVIKAGDQLEWSLDGTGLSGVVTADRDGEVTIPGISMNSSIDYTILRISKYEVPEEMGGYVLTSTPRDLRPWINGIEDRTIGQLASDVKLIIGNDTSQSDVKIKWDDGTWETVFNCTGNPDIICSAQEADVSPDKSKIVYSVTYGGYEYEHTGWGSKLMRGVTRSEIRVRDLVTGTDAPIPNQHADHHYRMPKFINNDKIVYSSTEAEKWPMKDRYNCHRGTYPGGAQRWELGQYCMGQEYPHYSFQLWTSLLNGTAKKNITPEQDQVIRPTVLKHPKHKGRILASCLQNREDKSYDKEASVGGGTRANHWWLCSWNNDGSDMRVVLGAHKSLPIPKKELLDPLVTGGQVRDELLAIRAVAEDDNGYIYVTFYYRQNHYGLGVIVKFDIIDHSVEGVYYANNWPHYDGNPTHGARPGSGRFTPSTLTPVTPFGMGQDLDVHRDALGRPMGKAGFAFNMGNGRMGVTFCRGVCYSPASAPTLQPEWRNGEPIANREIYEIIEEPVTDPFDQTQFKPLITSDTEHYWEAVRIMETPEAMPAPLRDEGAGCFLQVVDAKHAELRPEKAYDPLRSGKLCGIQGCAVDADDPNFHADNIHSLAIYGVTRPAGTVNNLQFQNQIDKVGVDKWLLGRCPLQPDGSVKCRVPCETEIMMMGQDEFGRAIAADGVAHSLRPGETRTCRGCHVHSEEAFANFVGTAEQQFATTMAAQLNPPVLNEYVNISWADVKPILLDKCQGCHAEINDNDGLLYDKIVWDREQIDFAFLSDIPTLDTNNRTTMPHTSGLLNRFFRESRLGWYVFNQRLDGRSNSDYANDANYNGPHNSGLTGLEAVIISEWVNQGAPLQ